MKVRLGGDPQKIAEDAVKAVEQAVQAETQASSMRALAQVTLVCVFPFFSCSPKSRL